MTDFDEDMQRRAWRHLVLYPRIIIGALIALVIVLVLVLAT